LDKQFVGNHFFVSFALRNKIECHNKSGCDVPIHRE